MEEVPRKQRIILPSNDNTERKAVKALQRYEIDEHGCDYPYSEGDWVRESDVKKLESLNEEMFAIIKSLVVNRRLIGDSHFEGVRERLIDMAETIVNKIEGEKK